MKPIPLKQWLFEEGDRLKLAPETIRHRLNHGGYPHVKVRAVNARVKFVEFRKGKNESHKIL